ncbi:hypothetical protein LTR66_017796 [Elasticomyces elasticus]|nr:hypothetical protein LTR66_017796 [Elasticomyces elasticus]
MPNINDISNLLDSEMDDNTNYVDPDSLISSVTDETRIAKPKAPAPKKTKKRKCVTMPKPKPAVPRYDDSVIEIAEKSSAQAAGVKRKRKQVIKEEVDEDALVEVAPRAVSEKGKQCGRPKGSTNKSPATKTVQTKKTPRPIEDYDEEVETSILVARSNFAMTKPAKPTSKSYIESKAKPVAKHTTKQIAKVAREALSDREEEVEDEVIRKEAPPKKRMRPESMAKVEPSYRRRAESASDTERGDPMLRRKLGDITRKFENIDLKYRNLKETGLQEANHNVEKLRKQCEAITEASNKLVSSLKRELAIQAPILADAKRAKKETSNHDAELSKLRANNNDLSASLSAAQNEVKALQQKLEKANTEAKAAARAASVQPESKLPQPTKPAPPAQKTVAQPVMPVNEAVQMQQLKIDLYTDLTGLIVRNVKKAEDGDIYDCIQTGRNGTLHFKLFIDAEEAKTTSFEEIEFLYTPQLDQSRDKELLEIMPAYLAEDITFARANASKFYARVVDTLTRKDTGQ